MFPSSSLIENSCDEITGWVVMIPWLTGEILAKLPLVMSARVLVVISARALVVVNVAVLVVGNEAGGSSLPIFTSFGERLGRYVGDDGVEVEAKPLSFLNMPDVGLD